MKTENDIYKSGLIPNKGSLLPDGSYWNCCSSANPSGYNGKYPLEVTSAMYEGKLVYIARWPSQAT